MRWRELCKASGANQSYRGTEMKLTIKLSAITVLSLLMAAPAQAARYEINFFGADPSGIGVTGFIDLDPTPNGVYVGSSNFMSSVVDSFEIRVAGDLRG